MTGLAIKKSRDGTVRIEQCGLGIFQVLLYRMFGWTVCR